MVALGKGVGKMNVKGFIMEDDQGREFMLVCEQPNARSAKAFSLRGWQRRRLVPLQYPEGEIRQIVAEVLLTLNDLFDSLPRVFEDIDHASSDQACSMTPLLRKVSREEGIL